jgi:hypothetical protein
MLRALRIVRTVVLVAVALIELAVFGLVGWWVAIAPDCRSIPGSPPPAASPRLPRRDRRPRRPLHHRQPLTVQR